MVSPVDPNEIRLTGENTFMRLHLEQGGPMTTHTRHWRILLSPAGPGHVLFLQSELTDDRVKIYSDNIALARWLQEEIENPSYGFKDQALPVAEAAFSRTGDIRSYYTERVVSRDEEISMTWYDFGEPVAVSLAPGSLPARPHGIYTVMIPARRTQLVLNGRLAKGRPFPEEMLYTTEGQMSSTCMVAWSETWVRPR